ncbi:MAG: wax ester/triacylglycerol synthase family O-acyltransferase [Rhodobiaceae bacterium]|nr:MAG: wax ester/triacylglycerol synthase family O-acyltransferase [Rhodobiaceae bacterium]
MKQLTGLDAAFLYLDQKNSPMHIGSIAIYDPSTAPGKFVRYKDILDFIEARLPLATTFRQGLANVPFGIDHPYWIEMEDFNLEYHVRHVALPKPGDWRQLCIQSARIMARPLDLTKPLWEFTVVEGLDNVDGVPKGSYAIVSKIHHSAIDGMAGVEIMNAIHTLGPNDPPPAIEDTWKPEKKPSAVEMAIRGYIGNVKQPFRWIEVAGKTIPGLARTIKGLLTKEFSLSQALSAPRTRFNAKISSNRVVEGVALDLARIKEIKTAVEGAKVNDVMLTIVGGALRRYLASKGELPETPLVAMAPISVRSDSGGGDLGNQVSAMLVQLGTHIADPEERILAIASHTKEQKALTKALGAQQMSELSKTAPALFTGIAARLYTQFGLANSAKPFFNTVVTNVPGPPVPIYSAGAEMVKYFGLLCLFDGLGLGHVVMSYSKEVTITITADRNMMPDPEFYATCLRESYEELERAILGSVQKAPKAKKAKAKSAGSKKAPARKKTAAKKAKPKKRASPKAAPATLEATHKPASPELPLQEKAS